MTADQFCTHIVCAVFSFLLFVSFFVTTFIPRNNKTIANGIKLFGMLDPGLKTREHLRLNYYKFYPTLQSYWSAFHVPRTQGYIKIHFFALIVDLGGERTRDTCMNRGSSNRLAIHYDSVCALEHVMFFQRTIFRH
jgi:hypothetical protein